MRNIEPRKELMYASAILCVSIILLWLYKIPVLGITYFWDEGWSYGVAIYKMSERIPSLLPASLPPELSRGHPLMYYFINALVAKTFGFSPSVMHLFSLLIATVFLIVFFLMLLRFTNPTFALLGSLLIMTQEAFIAQSSLMLPEIFISLLVMTTIYFLITDHILWYIISATMLVLTKESGLVVAASASLIYFSHLIRQYLIKHHTFLKLIKGSLLLFLPIITGLTFYAIQKATFGWFLFPLHVQMASFSQEAIINHLMVIWQFVFWGYGRENLFVMLVIMCFLVLLSALYQRKKFNNTIWKLTAMLLIVFSCYTLFSAINYIS
ncbi:MAG: glycosyltransferase family 39 protein, partial [Chitinophagales bacterium]